MRRTRIVTGHPPPAESDPLYAEAVARLVGLFQQAARLPLIEPWAVTLATADAAGSVSARTVLIKDVDAQGLVFHTQAGSRKGRDLAARPRAVLCVYWDALGRQLQVDGPVSELDAAPTDAYWSTRPRERQLAAWASMQSEELDDPEILSRRLRELEREYSGRPVPRPPRWVGYRLRPERIEFWTRDEARLNRREVYRWLPSGSWRRGWLQP